MVRYLNSLIVCLLLFFYPVCHGQEQSSKMCEDVFFYITMRVDEAKKNSRYYPLVLLIDNQSKDSVRIDNFNKSVFHKLDFTRKRKSFNWEFLTTSNRVPDDIIIVTGTTPKDQLFGDDVEVVIPPNSTFVSDIYIRYSSFIRYGKGYYKLCLYYEGCNRCIAELLIKSD